MKELLKQLRAAAAATVVLAIVCCGVYPLLVYGLAQALFPHQANGSLLVAPDGTVQGSRLLGQPFAGESHFHSRPSAAGTGYDGASSGGSNLGPTSKKLLESLQERVAAYRRENGLTETEAVPADAVTASGSGLDPHISVRNALLQAGRVARARRLSRDQVSGLIGRHTVAPDFGFLGEPRVNVLELNLALERGE